MAAKNPPNLTNLQIGPIVKTSSTAGTLYFVLSARKLPLSDRGLLGKTVKDPYIKWSVLNSETKTFQPAGATKFRQNEENPDWHDHVFSFQWKKGTGQKWRFEMMDKDLNPDDNIGTVNVDVDNYVARGQSFIEMLANAEGGELHVYGTAPVSFQLAASNIPRLDAFNGPSDPYVKCFFSVGASGELTEFARTETIKNVEDCKWEQPIVFGAYRPGNNQYLHFQVYDQDKLPKDDKVGEAKVQVDNLFNEKKFVVLKLADEKDYGDKPVPVLTVTPTPECC